MAQRVVLKALGFDMANGLLTRLTTSRTSSAGPRYVIPKAWERRILYHYHDHVLAGHLGIAKTQAKIQERYWWEGMHKTITKWIKSCPVCQRRKDPKRPRPMLQPIEVGGPFEKVAVDFVGPLPSTPSGKKYILVFTDYLSKWPEAFAVETADAETVAKLRSHVPPWVVSRFPAVR